MILCDICGDKTNNFKRISKEYRTNNISEICSTCNNILQEEILKLSINNKNDKNKKIKQFIKDMKGS